MLSLGCTLGNFDLINLGWGPGLIIFKHSEGDSEVEPKFEKQYFRCKNFLQALKHTPFRIIEDFLIPPKNH